MSERFFYRITENNQKQILRPLRVNFEPIVNPQTLAQLPQIR